jgi:transposase
VTIVKECITRALTSNPFCSAMQIADTLKREYNLTRSRQSASRYIQRMGFTLKKSYKTVDYPHNPVDVQNFCDRFQTAYNSELICIDETGFYVGDTFKRGYAPRGKRLNVSRGKQMRRAEKYSVVMAISRHGIVHSEVLSHNCKKVDFLHFLERLDVPKGATLLMDNIAFHHSKETKRLLESKECIALYTPPYSPRLNPIEYFFSTLKHYYRKRCPITPSTSFNYLACIQDTLSEFRTRDMSGYLSHVQKHVHGVLCNLGNGIPFTGYDVC